VLGSVSALIGVVALVGGGTLVGIHTTKRDGEGFYSSKSNAIGTPTHALVSDVDVGTDKSWVFRKGRLATIRITASGTTRKPVFVGLAREAQISAYLHGVAHDEVTDFDLEHVRTKRMRHAGDLTPPAPVAEHFWRRSASGAGRQVIRWPVESGRWSVVVMNADGTPGVHTRVAIGAKVGFVLWLGIALLAVGTPFVAGGAFAVYRGARPRRSSSTAVRAEPIEVKT
jgi:hypothetical protein